LQLVDVHPLQAAPVEDETVFPPDEKPNADINFRGESAPHEGQRIALIS
jgi:hypothetical protein